MHRTRSYVRYFSAQNIGRTLTEIIFRGALPEEALAAQYGKVYVTMFNLISIYMKRFELYRKRAFNSIPESLNDTFPIGWSNGI